eukprot:Gb_01403 [translate_table: standard]
MERWTVRGFVYDPLQFVATVGLSQPPLNLIACLNSQMGATVCKCYGASFGFNRRRITFAHIHPSGSGPYTTWASSDLACDASPCRSGIANDACCKAIGQSVQKGSCSCLCQALNSWGYSSLPTKCSSTGRCKSCSFCKCQQINFPIVSII